MLFFKTVHDAQTNITLRAKIQCAPSFVLYCTHTATTTFSFWGPLLGMFHFQATYLGYRWTRSPSRYDTCSHILLMGFCNQIMNENLPEPLVCHFTPHVLWSSKEVRMAISVRWKKNSFLVHIPHVSVRVLYYMRFDCMARFVTEIAFQCRIMQICENIDTRRASMSHLHCIFLNLFAV